MDALVRLLRRPLVVRASGIVVGLLFVWAALAKVGDVGALATEVHNFRILPVWSENLLAMVLPWIELAAGVSLVVGVRPRSGALVAAGLLAVFVVAILAAMARGLNFECGCFGTTAAGRVGLSILARDLAVLALSGVALLRTRP